MGKCKLTAIAACVVLAAATVWAALGVMSVQVKTGQLRANPSFLAPPVATVAYEDKIEVLQQQGDWYEAVKDGKKGWIHQSALASKKIGFGAGGSNAQTGASGEELALAGKGFNADVERQYKASNRNVDFTWVDRMEKMTVQPPEMVTFLQQGDVQPKKGGAK